MPEETITQTAPTNDQPISTPPVPQLGNTNNLPSSNAPVTAPFAKIGGRPGPQVTGDLDSATKAQLDRQQQDRSQEGDTGELPEGDPSGDDLEEFNRLMPANKSLTKAPKDTNKPSTAKTTVPAPAKVEGEDGQATEEAVKDEEDGKFKVDLTKTPFVKKGTQQATPIGNQNPNAPRNLEGLNEAEAKVFKNMSLEAFHMLRPVYDEFKVLKERALQQPNGRIPDSYLQHEQAYLLLPEFQANVQDAGRLDFEVKYWRDQLAAVEAGEDWTPLESYNAQTGKYQQGKPLSADGQAKAHIIQNLQMATTYKSEADQAVKNIMQGHKQITGQQLGKLKAMEEEFFPFYKDPNNPHRASIEQAFTQLPQVFRSSPFATFFAKGNVLIQNLHEQLQEALGKVAMYEGKNKKAETAKAGPTATNGATSSINHIAQEEEGDFGKFKDFIGR